MVPGDVEGMIVCPQGEIGLLPPIWLITDVTAAGEIAEALNAVPVPAEPVACTLIGGGELKVIFVTTLEPVQVALDRVNCQAATNGARNTVGNSGAINLIDAAVAAPSATKLELPPGTQTAAP